LEFVDDYHRGIDHVAGHQGHLPEDCTQLFANPEIRVFAILCAY